jgi:hypothetical protein
MNDQPGISVTSSRVSFVLGLIALMTVVWQGIGYAKDMESKIATHEVFIAEIRQQQKDMLIELKRLSEAVTELTYAIKGTGLQPQKRAS